MKETFEKWSVVQTIYTVSFEASSLDLLIAGLRILFLDFLKRSEFPNRSNMGFQHMVL